MAKFIPTADSEEADVIVLACMPVDRSGLPQTPELDAIVITDLYTEMPCDNCERPVWIGPRQKEAHELNGGKALALCYFCVFDAMTVAEVDPEEFPDYLTHLGGGYPVEGEPRPS